MMMRAALLAGTLALAGCTKEREVSVAFADPRGRMGEVVAGGTLTEVRGADSVVVIVHGLAEDRSSPAVLAFAEEAQDAGLATLRMDMRGADRSGRGLYYAGDSEDIAALVESAPLAKYKRVYVVGFSLGGHNVLRYAASPPADARVRAVASISSPIDLAESSPYLDQSAAVGAVIAKLVQQYAPFHAKASTSTVPHLKSLPAPATAATFTTVRQFDDAIVAPLLGHKDALDYYTKESVGPRLKDVKLPTAIIHGLDDPMVPIATVRAGTKDASPSVRVFEVHGKHVSLAPLVFLGQPGPAGVAPQLLAWLRAQP